MPRSRLPRTSHSFHRSSDWSGFFWRSSEVFDTVDASSVPSAGLPVIEDAPAPRYSATFSDNCASRGRIRCEDDGRASMLIIYALVVHGEEINVDS
jgi:hypothetical protein